VLVLGLLALGAGVAGAVGATIASYVAALVVGLLFLRALYPDLFMLLTPSTGSMGELLRYSIPSAFAGIFAMYMIWVNRLLVGYFLPLEETGVYQAVTQVALLFAMILSSFNLIFTPMSADLFAQQKIARLRELYRVSTKWALYVTIPIFMVVFTFPREVMTVLFGAPYAAGGLALRILTLGQLINILTGPVGSLLVMTGHQRRWSIITGAAFVLNVGLGVLLIPGVGLQGAATAIAVTQTGMFLLGLVQAWRILGGWPYDRRTIKGGLSALGAGLAMALLRVWLSMPVFGHMIVAAMVSVGVFFGLLLLMKLDEEDRQFVDLIKERWMNLRANNGA
jgi:O-antigen/teichoic acid export membrane protein